MVKPVERTRKTSAGLLEASMIGKSFGRGGKKGGQYQQDVKAAMSKIRSTAQTANCEENVSFSRRAIR